jgi:Bacterial-like globin
MSTDPTPFERIGGQPTVDRIIDAFYDGMETLPEARIIRALHPEDLGSTRVVLKKYGVDGSEAPQGGFVFGRARRRGVLREALALLERQYCGGRRSPQRLRFVPCACRSRMDSAEAIASG